MTGPPAAPYSLEKEHIVTDLTADRPQWILSAYGPGRQAPAQLFGGTMREQSFEEMRLLHYMAAASGNSQQAVCQPSLCTCASCY
jgi:nucleoporin NUP42